MGAELKLVTIIHADGRPDTSSVRPEPDLHELQEMVSGGHNPSYIELIPYFTKFNDQRVIWIYGNEEAKLIPLPVNQRATVEWHKSIRALPQFQHALAGFDELRGDIVIVQSAPVVTTP